MSTVTNTAAIIYNTHTNMNTRTNILSKTIQFTNGTTDLHTGTVIATTRIGLSTIEFLVSYNLTPTVTDRIWIQQNQIKNILNPFLNLSQSEQSNLESRYVITLPSETYITNQGLPYDLISNCKVICTLRTNKLVDAGFHNYSNKQ